MSPRLGRSWGANAAVSLAPTSSTGAGASTGAGLSTGAGASTAGASSAGASAVALTFVGGVDTGRGCGQVARGGGETRARRGKFAGGTHLLVEVDGLVDDEDDANGLGGGGAGGAGGGGGGHDDLWGGVGGEGRRAARARRVNTARRRATTRISNSRVYAKSTLKSTNVELFTHTNPTLID